MSDVKRYKFASTYFPDGEIRDFVLASELDALKAENERLTKLANIYRGAVTSYTECEKHTDVVATGCPICMMEDRDQYKQRYEQAEAAIVAFKQAAVQACTGTGEEGESPDCWGWHAKDYANAILSLPLNHPKAELVSKVLEAATRLDTCLCEFEGNPHFCSECFDLLHEAVARRNESEAVRGLGDE